MDNARDIEAYRIFRRLLPMPEVERAKSLPDLCGNDAQLIARVQELLDNHASDAGKPEPSRPIESVAPTAVGSDEISLPRGADWKSGDLLCRKRFRIIDKVGVGGMGVVYKAYDENKERDVALKFPTLRQETKVSSIARLRREVTAACYVVNEHVCQVFELHLPESGDSFDPFISMEFVDGDSVDVAIHTFGRVSGVRALEIAHDLGEGLDAIHRNGIIHRDIKPSNVMVEKKTRSVRILDFGIAAPIEECLARDGASPGTWQYMAPEARMGAATIQSDLYAMGLVLYTLYTGKPVDKQFSDSAEPPSSLKNKVADLPASLLNAVLKCLAKNPASRFATVREFLKAIPPLPDSPGTWMDTLPLIADSQVVKPLSNRAVGWLIVILFVLAIVTGVLLHPFTGNRGRAHRLPWISADLHKPLSELSEAARAMLPVAAGKPGPGSGQPPDPRLNSHDSAAPDEAAGFGLFRGSDESQQAKVTYWFRSSLQPMEPWRVADGLSDVDPPPTAPGMVFVRLNPANGRVLQAWMVDAPDIQFKAADIAPPPLALPHLGQDLGPPPEQSDLRQSLIHYTPAIRLPVAALVRIFHPADDASSCYVIATVDNRVIYIDVLPPVDASTPEKISQSPLPTLIRDGILFLALIPLSVVLALVNIHLKRSDVKQAMRLSAVIFTLMLASWLLAGGARGTALATLLPRFRVGVGSALFYGALTCIYYLAIDPYARLIWKRTWVGYARLAINWRGAVFDPIVGRSILTGATYGLLTVCLMRVSDITRVDGQDSTVVAWNGAFPTSWTTAAGWVAQVLRMSVFSMLSAMIFMVAIIFPYLFRRKTTLAPALASVVFGAIFFVYGGSFREGASGLSLTWGILIYSLIGAMTAYLLVREGVLSLAIGFFFTALLTGLPLRLLGDGWAVIPSMCAVVFLTLIVGTGVCGALQRIPFLKELWQINTPND